MKYAPTSRNIRRTFAALMLGIGSAATVWLVNPFSNGGSNVSELQAAEPVKVPPQILYQDWPKEADGKTVKKPDLVLILSGQTYGYLQKCGCSNPQKGGLERRYNFVQSLKAQGWEMVSLDLGDVARPLPYTPTSAQTMLKYKVAMQAMKMMGYVATSVGEQELMMPLLDALSNYTLQDDNKLPKVHAANISNKGDFVNLLTNDDVISNKSPYTVGVASVIGLDVRNKNTDRNVQFAPRTDVELDSILKNWKGKVDPDIKVMMYQGAFEYKIPGGNQSADAQTAAKSFPQFQIVVCKTDNDSEPPTLPTMANDGKTMIVRVGQRGQHVGMIGVYRGAKGTELYYQRVTMADEFDTPEAEVKTNAMVRLLQDYADEVKANDFLSKIGERKKKHEMQVTPATKGAQYVGDRQCVECHQQEHLLWSKSKHGHAYEALEKIASKPSGRNFDGECIVCHTVGYQFETGYVNEKTTAHLKHVQCESCHGPGSLHVVEEKNNQKPKAVQTHAMALPLSPWKVNGKGNLPSVETFKKMLLEKDQNKREAMMTPVENQVYLRVFQTCFGCHDIDNDPKFDLASYWEQINHSGFLKRAPAAPPMKNSKK
jgi:hypothetical protein